MTASAPSYTAVATSEASALVGVGASIMDSSIWVATITGLPAFLPARSTRRWIVGHLLGLHFDAEIAARDHDGVGAVHDLFEPVDGGRLFQLRHDRGFAAHQFAQFFHVLRTLDERQGHPIDAEFEREGQVAAVLFGQRRNRQDRADDADALAFGNASSGQDAGGGRLRFGLLDLQPDLAVVHQQMDAGRQGREDLGMRQRHPVTVAGRGVEVEADAGPFLDHERPFGHRAEPQLRPLEVGQDGDRAAGPGFDIAHDIEAFPVVLVAAVAEIETENVGARVEQGLDDLPA